MQNHFPKQTNTGGLLNIYVTDEIRALVYESKKINYLSDACGRQPGEISFVYVMYVRLNRTRVGFFLRFKSSKISLCYNI